MFVVINPAYIASGILFLASFGYMFLSLLSTPGNTSVKARRVYGVTSLLLVLYSLSYSLMTVTLDHQWRYIFWAIGFSSGLLFFPVWINFLLHMVFPKSTVMKRLSLVTIAIAAVLAFICVLSNDAELTMTSIGNQFSYRNSWLFIAAMLFTSSLAGPLIAIQFKWWSGAELLRFKRISRVFLVMAPLAAAIGFITDFVIPIFTTNTVIPLGSVSILFTALLTYILMLSSKAQSITVRNVSGFTFLSIQMPILVLDRQNNVGLENRAAIDFFGSSSVEKNILSVLSDSGTLIQSFFNDDFQNEIIVVETPSGVRTGEMMLTVERDKLGDAIFKVVIINDKTDSYYKDTLLEKALTDELTGARTRRYCIEIAEEEVLECIRNGLQYSAIIIDVDHFKVINDTYGHPVGDEVLRILVSRIRNALKSDTLLARYGGEEFVISLPDFSSGDAQGTAERIRAIIESDAFSINDEELTVTISLGVASLTGAASTFTKIISNADKALYKAKQSGRNKVVYYKG